MYYAYKGIKPVVHPSAFVHPQATVTGDARIGKDVYIGPSAAIRADFGTIIIDDGCNVQENCTLHMFPGVTVHLKKNAHIGHGAIIHGASIGENCLIGMNAVVMDNVILGKNCIVGALSFVKANQEFEDNSIILGNPAKKVKEVSQEMLAWKTKGTEIYQQLARDAQTELIACEALSSLPEGRTKIEFDYKSWDQKK